MLQHQNATVGRFHGNSSVVLHSDEAIKLISGITKKSKSGKKTTLFGINNFGTLMQYIWQRTQQNDPYADMALIDIELMIIEAKQLIDSLTSHVIKKLGIDPQQEGEKNNINNHLGMKLCILESQKPYTLTLGDPNIFSTPYSFMMIQTISQYDFFVRLLKTTKEYGLINKKHYSEMHYHSNNTLKKIFQRPYHYKDCKVTRQDIIAGTEGGKGAIRELGELPLDVIKGERSNEYGPTPKQDRFQ